MFTIVSILFVGFIVAYFGFKVLAWLAEIAFQFVEFFLSIAFYIACGLFAVYALWTFVMWVIQAIF